MNSWSHSVQCAAHYWLFFEHNTVMHTGWVFTFWNHTVLDTILTSTPNLIYVLSLVNLLNIDYDYHQLLFCPSAVAMKEILKYLGNFGTYQAFLYGLILIPGFLGGSTTLMFSWTGFSPQTRFDNFVSSPLLAAAQNAWSVTFYVCCKTFSTYTVQ